MTVVFLCIGAAKAGTSWLHRQLASHPECHFRSLKELHYFNAIDTGHLNRELDKHRHVHAQMLARLAEGRRISDDMAARMTDRAQWLDVLESKTEDQDAYLRYLNAGAGDAKVVGELTPAYALLSEDRLRNMSQMAPDVRLLFLMRDPVERLWSHIRMMAGRRDPDGIVTARRCNNIFNRVLSGEEDQIVRRSDYAATLTKITRAIPGKKLLIEVFENMTAGDGYKGLCSFLGVKAMPIDPTTVHAGQALAMSDEQRYAAEKWLQPQYEAAAEVLGRMPSAWTWKG